MEISNIKLGDGGDDRVAGSNEGVLGAQRLLALDGGQPTSSGTRAGGDAPEHPSAERIPHSETREGGRNRRPSTRPGPRCSKEERWRKEKILENNRKKAEDARKKRREEDVDGRRAMSPTGSETAPSDRTMLMSGASRAPSSASTTDDVSDGVLGDMEDLPVTFPLASRPAANGKRGRGRPPTTGEYVRYQKVQRAANEAKRKALDLKAEAEVYRTGPAAKARMKKASQKERRKRAGDEAADALLASQGDGADMAFKSVGTLRADAKFVADAVLKVANTSGNLKCTYIKELKVAASMVCNRADEFGRRVELTGDVAHLQAENARLNVEVIDLRGEIRSLKALVEAAKER